MLLAREEEEITNKASHQVLQEGKYHIYLQLKKIKTPVQEEHFCQLPEWSEFTEQVLWLLAKLFGNSWKDQATQSVGNRRSQGIPAGQHHKEVRKKNAIYFTILCQASSCQPVAVTALPQGRGAGLLVHSSSSSRNAAWKGMKEEGLEKARQVKCIRVQMRVGACFSKINAWSSKLDILPPQAARTWFLLCNEPPFPCTKTPLGSPFSGPDGRKSLLMDLKWTMSFPVMVDAVIPPCRMHSPCHDLELDNFLFKGSFYHFIFYYFIFYFPLWVREGHKRKNNVGILAQINFRSGWS